ncbi:transglycosylase [Sphaerisporangium siamense]|uniref:Putative membrane protein YeaQ/YmgE (Transglycosylase-associated protein family) n=1 Tax=Sphaerisporangium siamense TaxID=795645 RepID=A0A7W7D410_9ACTN|nr:GlsB/YeaQ/YmgE family stress response membrane protein [Sphaerisporangium siamense]MBB4698583.1 putative membrane protein YeaQ/YmgE (transglycosylase-associated protein family) [Sphaerisporangium siamense]GII85358.1 transglycosylase [Sphaerisporangium siamense]
MTIESILGAIVIGAIIGALGRLVLPGRQPIGWLVTIIVGIVAALIGTAIAQVLGVETTSGIDWIEIILQVVVAVIGVGLVAGIRGRGRTRV